jgi:hypothetical protein
MGNNPQWFFLQVATFLEAKTLEVFSIGGVVVTIQMGNKPQRFSLQVAIFLGVKTFGVFSIG